MKKQYFNFWVGLICLLAFFSANVYGFESEGFYFDVISEDDLTVKLSLVKYSDDLERVDIPATVSHEGKTYNVTVIDSTAFQNCYSTSVISIPETVTHIRFGSGIGSRPFNNCDVLTEISVAENNPQYSSFDGALYDKGQTVLLQFPKAKSSVSFPEAITTIGNYAFARCKGFTVMNIPKTVTTIGSYAFNNCERLTSITIPNSVTKIEDGAFARCAALTAIAVPESVTIIKDNTFAYCENLVSIDLPKSITEIEKSAFKTCTGLTSITIGSSTETIYKQAFHNCPALKTISCLAINPPVCWWGSPFDNYDKDLFVPTGSGDKYRSAEVWKEFDITEKTFSGIHSAETKEARTYTRSHNIVIENALPGTPLSVYNTAGVCIESMEISDSETEIALPAQGLYIVKYGDRSMKVVL